MIQNKTTRRTVRVLLATVILFVGLLGFVLPFLNGTLLVLAGLLILSLEIPSLEQWLDKHGARHPKVEHFYKKCKSFVRKHF